MIPYWAHTKLQSKGVTEGLMSKVAKPKRTQEEGFIPFHKNNIASLTMKTTKSLNKTLKMMTSSDKQIKKRKEMEMVD